MGRGPRSPGPAAYEPSPVTKHVPSTRGFGLGPARKPLSRPEAHLGPGPAAYAYDHSKKIVDRKPAGGKIGPAPKTFAHDLHENESGPGPGEYSPNSASRSVQHTFGSGPQHLTRKGPADGPGPGKYTGSSQAESKSRRISHGFGHGTRSGIRISPLGLPQAAVGPGPAAYNYNPPKRKVAGGKIGPAPKTLSEKTVSSPGPGEYDVHTGSPTPGVVGYRPSKAERPSPGSFLRGQGGQGPASYYVAGDISKRVKGKVSYHPGGVAHAGSLGQVFDAEGPGPAAYLPREPQHHVSGGYLASISPWVHEHLRSVSSSPGPGEYLEMPEVKPSPGVLSYFPSTTPAHSEPSPWLRDDWNY